MSCYFKFPYLVSRIPRFHRTGSDQNSISVLWNDKSFSELVHVLETFQLTESQFKKIVLSNIDGNLLT